MTRLSRLALVMCAALVVVTAAGCRSSGGNATQTPAGTPITDPAVIITQSLNGVSGVKNVHLSATVNGAINAGAISSLSGSSGAGALSGIIKLDGATIVGDFDLTKQAFHISLSLPTLFGMTIDIIQVDGYQYTMLSTSGNKYAKSKVSPLPLVSAAPSASLNITDTVNQLRTALDQAGATATLAGTEKVNGEDAYRVSISIPISKINDAISALMGSSTAGITLSSVTFDYWVYTGSLLPAKLQLTAASPTLGNIDVAVTLSKYNESVDIKAPPADMVQ